MRQGVLGYLRSAIFLAIVALFACVLLPADSVNAAINSQINFQGKLTNTDGTNVTNGTYSIVFSIYTVASGGSNIWTETQGSVSVTDGIFRVALGSGTALPGSVDFNSSSLYLGIKVGADPEMSPRVQFTAAPYAFNSDKLGGIASTGFAQLGLAAAQSESSTNALIFLNKTSTGNLLQLQQGAADKFVVSNAGLLTTASVNSTSIVDGTVANGDLVNSGVTVVAGSGLVTGGAVSLGGSVTVDIGAGNGITVNANDIAVRALTSADALSATTSSGSGIEVLASGAGLLQGCADTQILKWNETTDVWACGTDATTPGADTLNFTELSDTLALDAATTISLGANNFTTNLSGTGDYAIQFGGNTVFQILDTGAVTIGNILADQTIGVDNGTGAINIATDTDANTVNIGTGTAADTVTVGDANANVAITDAQWSVSGAGAASFASVSGAGLVDCDQSDDVLKWDSATGQFSCGTNRATFHNTLNGDFTITASTTFADVDNNGDATDDIGFPIGANETWVFESSSAMASNATADSKWQVIAPAGATCDISVSNIEQAISVANLACTTSTGNIAVALTDTNEITVSGVVSTAATAGNVIVQFGQNAASGTSTIYAGSYITAYRISGADYAEIYYSDEDNVSPGMIVALSGKGPSQVKKATIPYSDQQIGIYSTSPGKVIGDADGSGKPIPIALSGRVPISLSTENGLPKAGDMVTASEKISGYGMRASRSGYVVGQLMLDAVDNGDGTASGYVYVRHGYWQAPAQMELQALFNGSALSRVGSGNIEEDDLELNSIKSVDGTPFDAAIKDQIIRGFTLQQEQLTLIEDRLNKIDGGSIFLDIRSLMNSLQFTDGTVTYLAKMNFTETVVFKDEVLFGKNAAGNVTFTAGEKRVEVLFDPKLTRIPYVSTTPNEFISGSWKVSEVDESGFVVELSENQKEDVSMTWQATLIE